MTPGPPIASFLIPVYNGESFLAEALESALGQTEKNIEIVVVDDGSTDSTREILRRYAAQDARVRVFEEEHKGLVPTLNRGLEVARGKYICRLDADDIATPDRVEKQVKFLEEHPDHVLVGGQAILIGPQGETKGEIKSPLSHQAVEEGLKKGCCFQHSAVMFRRAEILGMGGYDSLFDHSEDYDLWIRLAANYRLANLPDFACLHRWHGRRVSFLGALRQIFTTMCIRAAFRGASREAIRHNVRAEERDFVPALRRLGYRDGEIAETIAGYCIVNAAQLNAVGSRGAALELISQLKRHLKGLQSNSRYLAQAYSWEFVVSLGSRHYLRALRCLLLAFVTSPLKTAKNILSRLPAPQNIVPKTDPISKVSINL